jgi:hypothetical protein
MVWWRWWRSCGGGYGVVERQGSTLVAQMSDDLSLGSPLLYIYRPRRVIINPQYRPQWPRELLGTIRGRFSEETWKFVGFLSPWTRGTAERYDSTHAAPMVAWFLAVISSYELWLRCSLTR